jgi:hypothetical protein
MDSLQGFFSKNTEGGLPLAWSAEKWALLFGK